MTTVPIIHAPSDPAADAVGQRDQAIVVRPIAFTAAPGRWRVLLDRLGARTLTHHPDWSVHALPGGGRIAVHSIDDPAAVHTELGFEVTGRATLLAEVGDAVTAAGGRLHEVVAGQGPTLRLVTPDGLALWIDDATPDPRSAGDAPGAGDGPGDRDNTGVITAPLHLTTHPREVAGLYRALGLRPGLSSTGGGWHDLAGDGVVCVHGAEQVPRNPVIAAFWVAEVDELASRLHDAGVRCDVVDEAHGRTLLVEHPDHPEGEGEPDLPGERLWITEIQRDTYGYVDHRPAARS